MNTVSLTYLIKAQQCRDLGCMWMCEAWLALYRAAKRREAMFGTSVEQLKKVNA